MFASTTPIPTSNDPDVNLALSSGSADSLKSDNPRAYYYRQTGSFDGYTPPAPAGTPSSTPAAGDPNADAYSRITGNIADRKTALESSLLNPPAPQTEDQIRTKNMSDAQALIDNINKEFDTKVASEMNAGAGRKAQSDAVDVAAGLVGSDFNVANRAKADAETTKNVDAINAQRATAVSGIITNVNQRSQDMARTAQSDYQTSVANATKAADDIIKGAKDDAMALAKNGIALDKLKAQPDLYNSLIKQSGMNPLVFDATYNEGLDAANKVTYTYHNLGNGITLRTGVKADGTAVPEEKINAGLAANQKPIIIDKVPYIAQYDDAGNLTGVKKADGFTSNPGTKKSKAPTLQEAGAAMASDLEKLKGTDGYISPDDYATNISKWVQAGYPASTFHTRFSNYRNPTDSYAGAGAKSGSATSQPIIKKK